MKDRARRLRATIVGGLAVLLWALLALFTAASGAVPPFQLAALSFAVASLLGLAYWRRNGERLSRYAGLGWRVWALGIGGLFGYHFFYFLALRHAPAVEASLIAYLWPLLIVLFSGLLPGERLGWHHLAGALLGLAGAGLLVTGGRGLDFKAEFALGYGAAIACALTWSSYSVLSRRFGSVPTGIVTLYCAATCVLATAAHLAFEVTHWPENALQWLAVLGLGLGPVGAAFFFWDHGVKHGHIQALGASSYAAPLLSTLVLLAAGLAEPRWSVAAACLLITGGAVLASKDLLRVRRDG